MKVTTCYSKDFGDLLGLPKPEMYQTQAVGGYALDKRINLILQANNTPISQKLRLIAMWDGFRENAIPTKSSLVRKMPVPKVAPIFGAITKVPGYREPVVAVSIGSGIGYWDTTIHGHCLELAWQLGEQTENDLMGELYEVLKLEVPEQSRSVQTHDVGESPLGFTYDSRKTLLRTCTSLAVIKQVEVSKR
jgi:hypothetical protein